MGAGRSAGRGSGVSTRTPGCDAARLSRPRGGVWDWWASAAGEADAVQVTSPHGFSPPAVARRAPGRALSPPLHTAPTSSAPLPRPAPAGLTGSVLGAWGGSPAPDGDVGCGQQLPQHCGPSRSLPVETLRECVLRQAPVDHRQPAASRGRLPCRRHASARISLDPLVCGRFHTQGPHVRALSTPRVGGGKSPRSSLNPCGCRHSAARPSQRLPSGETSRPLRATGHGPEVSPSRRGREGRRDRCWPRPLPRQHLSPGQRQLLAVLRGSVALQTAVSETGRGAQGGCMTVLHQRGGPWAAPWLRPGHLCPHPRWVHLGWPSLHSAWERAGGTQGQGPPRTALGTPRPLT